MNAKKDSAVIDAPRTRAQLKHLRMTPMKARRIVNLIRGTDVAAAASILQFSPQAAAEPVGKLLASAIANAEKRFQPRAQGRAFRIRKRTCHITIELVSLSGAPKTGITEGRRGTRSSQSAKGGNR
jgi:large subunit ribosomal protein L22